MDMERLKEEIGKVIFPCDGVKGEILVCEVVYRDDLADGDACVFTGTTVATYPFLEEYAGTDEEQIGFNCDSPDDLLKMCDPDDVETDIRILSFRGMHARWDCEDWD